MSSEQGANDRTKIIRPENLWIADQRFVESFGRQGTNARKSNRIKRSARPES